MLSKLVILLTSSILCVLYEYFKNKNKVISSIVMVCLVLFLSTIFTFREFILDKNLLGTDYYEYKTWFEIKSFSNLFNDVNNFGFNLLISIIKIFTQNFYFFLFICSLLINTCITKFIKDNSINFTISMLIYICLYYITSFNITRQWIAYSIFLYAFKYIKSKKIIKYLFLIILASLFHNTALFLFSFYPLINIKNKSKSKVKTIIIIGVMLVIFSQPLINALYKISNLLGFDYVTKYQTYDGSVGNYTNFLLSSLTFILLIIFNKEIKNKIENHRMFEISTIYLSLFSVMSLLITKSFIFNRINLYFTGALWISLPYVLTIFNSKTRILVEYIVFIILGFAFIA